MYKFILLLLLSSKAFAFPYFVSLDISNSPPELISASAPSGSYSPDSLDFLPGFEFEIAAGPGVNKFWTIPFTVTGSGGSASGVWSFQVADISGQYLLSTDYWGGTWEFTDDAIDYSYLLEFGKVGHTNNTAEYGKSISLSAVLPLSQNSATPVPDPSPLLLGVIALVILRRAVKLH